jgi:hypothetical protein
MNRPLCTKTFVVEQHVNVVATSSKVVQDGRWHYVLLAIASNTVQVYLDGTLVRYRLVPHFSLVPS